MNVQKYLDQLIVDIEAAIQNGPAISKGLEGPHAMDTANWEEQEATISLEKWCGIKKEQLPTDDNLSEQQLSLLLSKIHQLLDAYFCSAVFQLLVPERIQYRTIRARFHQKVPLLSKDRYFFFSLCDKQTKRQDCLLGEKYCHCVFFENFFQRFSSPKESELPLNIEIDADKIYILKSRYGEDWYRYLRFDEEDFKEE